MYQKFFLRKEGKIRSFQYFVLFCFTEFILESIGLFFGGRSEWVEGHRWFSEARPLEPKSISGTWATHAGNHAARRLWVVHVRGKVIGGLTSRVSKWKALSQTTGRLQSQRSRTISMHSQSRCVLSANGRVLVNTGLWILTGGVIGSFRLLFSLSLRITRGITTNIQASSILPVVTLNWSGVGPYLWEVPTCS